MASRFKRLFAVILAVILCFGLVTVGANSNENTATILFTHDLHSRMDSDNLDGQKVGGFARLKTLIDEKRSKNSSAVLVDGGDFSMGTLYQTIYETHAGELTMLGYLGYDATTFGNHEFDYKSLGVSNMLNTALKNAEADENLKLPEFLISNIDWNINTSDDNKIVKQALENYGAKEYTVIEKGGIKYGIFAVLGQDAEECAPESGIDFDDIVESSKKAVEKLQEKNVDMIICLSHSGTDERPSKSEDEVLAKKVPQIDVIVSGHSHTVLETPIKQGDTYIVSSGEYGRNLGEIKLKPNKSGRWDLVEYKLNRVDSSVEENAEITQKLDTYRAYINESYLKDFGFSYDEVIAVNNYDFTPISEFGKQLREETLGTLIADSYMYAVKQAEGENYKEVAVTISPCGTIRDSLQKGDLTVWDIFNISCLGIGPDRITGYPLVSVYLTGAELKTVAEIDVSVSSLMSAAQLYPAGIRWEYNSNRLILNRVTDVKLLKDGKDVEIQDDKLYRVVAGLYSAQMLGAVEDTSMGILSVTPKDENGNPITDFNKYIIYDENGNEVKEWYALASYLQSFPKNENGISVIPEYYSKVQGRKVDTDSKNIIDILKNPNKIAIVIYAVMAVVIALIVLITILIVRKIKRNKLRKS